MAALVGGHLSQQSPTTCGSACLVVARMLVDPAYADDVLAREASIGTDRRDPLRSRFAAHEREVHTRTNAVRSTRTGGRLAVPWPRALGTPPWGARRELEAVTGLGYELVPVAADRPQHRRVAYERLRQAAAAGCPALLYVGSRAMPRHVVLVVPSRLADDGLTVYEPSRGLLLKVTHRGFVDGSLRLGGWTRPWVAVVPSSSA